MICTRLTTLFTILLAAAASGTTARNSHRGNPGGLTRRALAVEIPEHLTPCMTTTLSWNGTKAPYSVGILVGRSSDAPLYHLGRTNETSLSWEVDLAPNTTVTIAVKGATGMIAYSKKLVIEDGDVSCLRNSSWTPTANSARNATRTNTTSVTPTGVTPTGRYINGTNNATNGIAANPAAATTPVSGASRITAGFGLLLASALLVLVA